MSDTRSRIALTDPGTLFGAVAPDLRARLLDSVEPITVPRGSVIVTQGSAPELLYLVIQGSVGLSTTEEDAGPTMVEILGPGETFPLPSVMLRVASPVAATALAHCRLAAVPAARIHEAAAEDGALMRAALAQMARHWRGMLDQVVDLKTRDATQRAARFLARRLLACRGPVDLPEPRTAIAARLGMTPESLSRVLHGLEAAGLLRLHGRRVDVPDRAALLRAALPRSEARARG